MKQIYLINTRNRAASYGIGTYINQLITCLCQTASLYLTVVELDSDEKEVTLVKQDNIRYLKFPQISSFLYNTYTDRYNRNVAYLLSLFVDEKIGCIFHFNYLHHASLARCIKSRFPEASIILTIHYFKVTIYDNTLNPVAQEINSKTRVKLLINKVYLCRKELKTKKLWKQRRKYTLVLL